MAVPILKWFARIWDIKFGMVKMGTSKFGGKIYED